MKKLTTLLTALLLVFCAYAQTEEDSKPEKKRKMRTTHGLDIDLGINNYLKDGKSPEATNELYAVKPFGSWYVGLSGTNRTNFGGAFFLEWGGKIDWYNFKFQNESVRIGKDDTEVFFLEDTRTDIDPVKSKLTAAYVDAFLVPTLRFGDSGNDRDNWCFDWDDKEGFRIGVGGYAGYKIGSYSKFVYEEGGDKRKEKDKDSYYLNNWRYGARLQVGFREVDFFVNYDISELFVENKGPQLNAFSFGITL